MKKLSLATKVFIGFVGGILLGLIFGPKVVVIKPVGDIFLRLIKMIVVPLIFFSITTGISQMGDIKKLRKIGTKTFIYYGVTTLIAGCIGLAVAHIVKPGVGVDLGSMAIESSYEATKIPSFAETVVNMFPDNIIKAMTETNLMQIIVFAIFFGISLVHIGEKGSFIGKVMESGANAMYKLTEIVMTFSPFGVAALMAATVGEYGLKIFGPLGKFILTDYFGLVAVILLMYLAMLKFIAKVPLGYFFKKILRLWAVTASTTSSSGSLPVTIDVVTKDFDVDQELASFTLPLGATVNMNGAVVYYSAAILFVSQIYGVNLSLSQQIMIVFMTTLVSVGSPGIPGGGIVMTIMLLTTMGLPMEVVGMIAGIYRVIDMGHTTLNVTGDVVSTLCIAKQENMMHQIN